MQYFIHSLLVFVIYEFLLNVQSFVICYLVIIALGAASRKR